MPIRKHPLVTDGYYHIFNRGVEKRKIFLKENDYQRFVDTLKHCRTSIIKPSRKHLINKTTLAAPPADIVAYSLMPNHFHLLLKQNLDNGIALLLNRLLISYTRYFNLKYDRVGPLFEGRFKSVPVDTDEQLIHLSRYIHLNPVVAGITDDPRAFQWSSFRDYLGEEETFIKPQIVLGNFVSKDDYEQFVNDQIDYAKQLEELKHLHLD